MAVSMISNIVYVEKDEFIKRFGFVNAGTYSDIKNEYGTCTVTQYIMIPNRCKSN